MPLLHIKDYVKQWKGEIAQEIKNIDYQPPKLVIFQIGNNEASNRYVRNKKKDCEEVGIQCDIRKFEDGVPQYEIARQIASAQCSYDGVMLQLPVPQGYNENYLISLIDKHKDVDGLTSQSNFVPCTPLGIMKYLEHCNFDLEGKNVVICGRSEIVGKPLAKLMQDKNATVTVLHSRSRNHQDYYALADLIVSAVGKANFLDCTNINVPVIDVGINFVDGKLVGDCCNTDGKEVTPVPGGVGLLTRCALLENTLAAALEERKYYD